VSGYHPTYDLKTNDSAGASSDFSKMTGLINLVNKAANGSASASDLESGLDVQEFLKFSAVAACLGNYDDSRYSYNNYYLYFVPSTGKVIYIPYDYDWSLGAESSSANMVSRGAYDEGSCQGGTTNANPIFKATFFKKSGSTSYSKSNYQSSLFGFHVTGPPSRMVSSLITAYTGLGRILEEHHPS
jgi:spore coat protein CotH